jgi:hypothetical protein
MDSGSGSPVQRNYVGPRRKVIHWPGAKGAPEPEPEPDPEPLWTPATITSSFTGMATAAAVTGGGVVVATKAPSLFMTWLPRILIVLAVLLIVGLLIYYAFLHKANKEEEQN